MYSCVGLQGSCGSNESTTSANGWLPSASSSSLGGLAEHARRVRLGVVLAESCVGEVLAHAFDVAVVAAQPLREPALELLVGDVSGSPAEAAVADHRDVAIEAQPKGAPGAGEGDERVVAHRPGPVAGAAQRAREGRADLLDRRGAGSAPEVGRALPAAEGEDAAPGEDRAPGRHGRHGLGEEAVEADAVARRARRCWASGSAASRSSRRSRAAPSRRSGAARSSGRRTTTRRRKRTRRTPTRRPRRRPPRPPRSLGESVGTAASGRDCLLDVVDDPLHRAPRA